MSKSRFYIEKISIQGPGKPNAEISFETGVNIVTGSSDTGKSYVFKCIDYVFGAEDSPKKIPESQGYEDIYLQIKTNKGETFTIFRSLISASNIKVTNSTIEKFSVSYKRDLGQKSNTKNGENISEFLLELIGIKDIYLKTNAQNKTKKLSFRDIVKLTLIDETRIITESSPVYLSLNNYLDLTFEKSVFKYLLTESSDNLVIEIEEPKIYESRIKGKLEFIDIQILNKNHSLEGFLVEKQPVSSTELQSKLESLLNKVKLSSHKINDLTTQREKHFMELQAIKSKTLYLSELLRRFNLLEEHYKNDLDRLQFILDGDFILKQLITKDCPICGSELNETHKACLDKSSSEKAISDSINTEHKKVTIKLRDLNETINSTKKELLENKELIQSLEKFIETINEELQNKLIPIMNNFQKEIDIIIHLRELENKISSIQEEIKWLTDNRNILEKELENKPKNTQTRVDFEAQILNEFCKKIEQHLLNWNYSKVVTVNFNIQHKVFDIEISGRSRNSHGKGIRAITYTSFVLGLLDFCIDNNKPHTGFVILDSPLTTYHSNQKREEEDEVDKDIQTKFFDYLTMINKDRQIIIFDNKTPNEQQKLKFNYIEFSKDDTDSRNGFFSK